jgi:hypothetical protein
MIFAAQFVNMIFLILNIVILTKLCKRFHDSKYVCLLTLLLYLTSYRIQIFSLELFAENVLTTLYLLTAYLMLDVIRSQLDFKKITLITFINIYAFYCKPESTLLFISCIVYLFFIFKTRFTKYFLYTVFIYLIGILPWLFWIHSITNNFSLSGKTNAIIDWANKEHHGISLDYVFNFPHLDHADNLGDLFHHLSTMEHQTFRPTFTCIISNMFEKPIVYICKYMGVLLPFFLIGFFLKKQHWKKPIVQFPMLLFGLSFLCMTVFYPSLRFWLPFMPFLYIYTACEILFFYGWVRSRYSSKKKYTFVVVSLAILLQYPFGWFFHPEYMPYPVLHTDWHRYVDLSSSHRLATNHASLIYHFQYNNPVVIPIASSAKELHHFCVQHSIDYLFFYSWNPTWYSPIFPSELPAPQFFVEKARIPLGKYSQKFILVLQRKVIE